jgi:hypothetical protein
MDQVSEEGVQSLRLGEGITQAIHGTSGVAQIMALSAVLHNTLDGMPEDLRPPEVIQLLELLPKIISKLELASRARENSLIQ